VRARWASGDTDELLRQGSLTRAVRARLAERRRSGRGPEPSAARRRELERAERAATQPSTTATPATKASAMTSAASSEPTPRQDLVARRQLELVRQGPDVVSGRVNRACRWRRREAPLIEICEATLPVVVARSRALSAGSAGSRPRARQRFLSWRAQVAGRCRVMYMCLVTRPCSYRFEWHLARKHLVHHDAERVDVAR